MKINQHTITKTFNNSFNINLKNIIYILFNIDLLPNQLQANDT